MQTPALQPTVAYTMCKERECNSAANDFLQAVGYAVYALRLLQFWISSSLWQ
jgi:hypothetical protein